MRAEEISKIQVALENELVRAKLGAYGLTEEEVSQKLGGILLYFGYQSSQTLGDQVYETITGRFRDSTIWFFIFGAVSAVVGIALMFLKR